MRIPPEIKREADREYRTIQNDYLDIIKGYQFIKLLTIGKLPWANWQNILHQCWLVVNNFPEYLYNLGIRTENEGYSKSVRKFLLKNVDEEIEHKRMWSNWAKESDVSLSHLKPIPEMKRMHQHLAEVSSNNSIPVPQVLGDITVGVEGMVGVLTRVCYNGINMVHYNKKNKPLNKDGLEWLDEHFKHDFRLHPTYALLYIKLLSNPEDYPRIRKSALESAEMFARAFDAAGRMEYKPHVSLFKRFFGGYQEAA